jgi:hypothetical protein
VSFPEQAERAPSDDLHSATLACSTIGNKLAAVRDEPSALRP